MMSEPASSDSVAPPESPPPSRHWLLFLKLLPFLAGALWLGHFGFGWTFLFAPAIGVTVATLFWIGSRWL